MFSSWKVLLLRSSKKRVLQLLPGGFTNVIKSSGAALKIQRHKECSQSRRCMASSMQMSTATVNTTQKETLTEENVNVSCDPSLVVFDKDGTLIDFNLMWGSWVESQAWKLEMTSGLPVREKLFDVMGYDWIHRSIKSQGAMCCTPMGQLYKLAVKVLRDEGVEEHKAESIIREIWSMPDAVKTSRPLGDIKGVFNSIKQMNMKIGVCTTDNREPTLETLHHLGVFDLVDVINCGDDELPAKPAPEQIWTMCRQLNIEPNNTVMIGDTNTDMQLGRNAGCGLSIGVLDGASSLEDLAASADILVPSIDKVVKVLFQYGQQARRHNRQSS